MSVEIAWKQNILVTDFHLLKPLLVVLGFGSQAFVCGFSRQNINSVVCSCFENALDYKPRVLDQKIKEFPSLVKIQTTGYNGVLTVVQLECYLLFSTFVCFA